MDENEVFQILESDRYLEREVRRVTGIELEQARIFQKFYSRARNRIMDRLLQWSGSDTFTEARLNATLAAIDEELIRLSEVTGDEINFGSEIIFEQAQTDVVNDLNKLEKMFTGVAGIYPHRAVELSLDRSNYLINRYQTSIARYNFDLRTKMQQELANAVAERKTSFHAVQSVQSVLNVDEWKVRRIVRTELANIYSLSKLMGMQEAKESITPDLLKTVYNPLDHRTAEDSKRFEAMRQIIPLEQDFEYVYNKKGDIRRFAAPPDRPNDRGVLIPIRAAWIQETKQ